MNCQLDSKIALWGKERVTRLLSRRPTFVKIKITVCWLVRLERSHCHPYWLCEIPIYMPHSIQDQGKFSEMTALPLVFLNVLCAVTEAKQYYHIQQGHAFAAGKQLQIYL